MTSSIVDTVIDQIIKKKEFKNNVNKHIKEIMKDGKIDYKDLPTIILLVLEVYNSHSSIKLTLNDIPVFIRKIVKKILDDNDLIPDNEEEKFLTLLEMGIKLIMIQPKVKKMCKLLPCF